MIKLLVSVIVAFIGGYLASVLHVPLPWMLGALLTSIVWNICTPYYSILRLGRRVGQFIIGVSLGLYFTKDVVELIAKEWRLLSLGVLLCLLVSLVTIFVNSRNHPSFSTIYFAYLPGGASEMVNMGKSFGADSAFITIGHTVRLVVLVFSVPLLATIWSDTVHLVNTPTLVNNMTVISVMTVLVCSIAGVSIWKKLKQANPWVVGALLGAALPTYFMEFSMKVPMPLLALSQVLLAMALANLITIKSVRDEFKYIKGMVISSILSISALIIMAYIIATLHHIEFLNIGLGMMPGGISEMGLTAKQLSLNVAFVTTMQALRLLIVMIAAQPIFIWIESLRNKQ